jgi:hypothetical protein
VSLARFQAAPDLYLLLGRQGIQWGWARRGAWQHQGEMMLGASTDEALRSALASLASSLPALVKPGGRLIVTVADAWLAQAGLPWPAQGGALDQLARAQLLRAGFEPDAEALMRLDDAPMQGVRLVVAYPGWLMRALAALSADLGLTLHSVLPVSCAVAAMLSARGAQRQVVAYVAAPGDLTEVLCAGAGGPIVEVSAVPGNVPGFPDADAIRAAWQRLQLRRPHVCVQGGAGWIDLRRQPCRQVTGLQALQPELPAGGAGLALVLASGALCSPLDAVTRHGRPARWQQALLALLVLVLLLAGLFGWQQARDLQQLQQAIDATQGTPETAEPAPAWRRDELPRVMAVNAAIRALNLPVDALLQALEPPRDIRVMVLGVETIAGEGGAQTAGRLRISAQAPSSGEMARYVAWVAERRPFVAAYLTRHEQIMEAGAPLFRFTLEATWTD